MVFEADKEGKGYRLKDAFFVECVFNLFQFDDLKCKYIDFAKNVLEENINSMYMLL